MKKDFTKEDINALPTPVLDKNGITLTLRFIIAILCGYDCANSDN